MKHFLSSDPVSACVTAESTFLPSFGVAVPGQEFFGGDYSVNASVHYLILVALNLMLTVAC